MSTPNIFIVDDLPPEAVAMLQALYSRSPKSVIEHLEQVRTVGTEKFMSTYYVGYGHKSIGDCGSTSVFAERVSMLVAKAIQDWPLYSGQEASTRYLDMTTQEFMNPLGTTEGQAVQDRWRAFYSKTLEALVPSLKERFPIKEGDKDVIYEKAIKARAFDIARGFLPAGAATFVSWHTNLRQAADHLKEMRHHVLPEVRDIAESMLGHLRKRYTASFEHKRYDAEEAYIEQSMAAFSFHEAAPPPAFTYKDNLDHASLACLQPLLQGRPARAELHQRFRRFGTIDFVFPLDFGSYRDLQRQRSAVQEMPLLTTQYGFYPWYLEQLPGDLRDEAAKFLDEQEYLIYTLTDDRHLRQYYVGMGYTIRADISCTLPAAVYTAELRSTDAVHPTLRVQAQRMGDALVETLPFLTMHHDRSPGTWNIKRGTHDIVKV